MALTRLNGNSTLSLNASPSSNSHIHNLPTSSQSPLVRKRSPRKIERVARRRISITKMSSLIDSREDMDTAKLTIETKSVGSISRRGTAGTSKRRSLSSADIIVITDRTI